MRLLSTVVSLVLLGVVGGTAWGGTLTPAPASRDFGNVSVSAAAAMNTVVLTNASSPTTVNGFTMGAGCGEFTATAAVPVTLNAGDTLTVNSTDGWPSSLADCSAGD